MHRLATEQAAEGKIAIDDDHSMADFRSLYAGVARQALVGSWQTKVSARPTVFVLEAECDPLQAQNDFIAALTNLNSCKRRCRSRELRLVPETVDATAAEPQYVGHRRQARAEADWRAWSQRRLTVGAERSAQRPDHAGGHAQPLAHPRQDGCRDGDIPRERRDHSADSMGYAPLSGPSSSARSVRASTSAPQRDRGRPGRSSSATSRRLAGGLCGEIRGPKVEGRHCAR